MPEETKKLTPEEQQAKKEDFAKRSKGFNEELIPLLGKYRLGLMGRPLISADGRIVAEAVLFDDVPKAKVEQATPEKPTGVIPA